MGRLGGDIDDLEKAAAVADNATHAHHFTLPQYGDCIQGIWQPQRRGLRGLGTNTRDFAKAPTSGGRGISMAAAPPMVLPISWAGSFPTESVCHNRESS